MARSWSLTGTGQKETERRRKSRGGGYPLPLPLSFFRFYFIFVPTRRGLSGPTSLFPAFETPLPDHTLNSFRPDPARRGTGKEDPKWKYAEKQAST